METAQIIGASFLQDKKGFSEKNIKNLFKPTRFMMTLWACNMSAKKCCSFAYIL